VILLWGSNAREAHPIFFHHVLKAIHSGARMYAIDPRRTSTAEWADTWLGLNVGSDVALSNGIALTLVREEDAEEIAFTMPHFVEQGDELAEITRLVITARERWRELEGLGG
jgi:anaerobic selenocysteine-containing dehydrogenase